MFKKTITFDDFSDPPKQVTETHWFNMTKQQMIEWEAKTGEGILEYFLRISRSNNKQLLYDAFEDLLLRSYGIKSEDGSRHAKSPEISQNFKNSAAFDAFFMEFFSDETKGLEFIKGILPQDWVKQSEEQMDVVMKTSDERLRAVTDSVMPPPPPPALLTNEQITKGRQILEGTSNE